MAINMKLGTIIKSSNWPRIGMKSGIISMGESRYAIAIPISHLDSIGVCGSNIRVL